MAAPRLLLKFRPSCFSSQFLRRSKLMTNKVIAPTVVSRRFISEDVLEEERKKQISWLEWLTDPVKRALNPPEEEITEEMLKEREELLARVQACYYKKPPEEPGKELFVEAMDMLMRQGDLHNVETLWRLAGHQKIYFEDEYIDKVEDFMLDAKEKQWYES